MSLAAATATSAAPDRGVEAATPSRPTRDPWPDNTKLVLIVLVAVGHLLSNGITDRVPAAHALYVWIYLFHMPAFIFLAGYFASSRQVTERSLQNIVTRLIVPFATFTVLYAVAIKAANGRALRVDFVDPYWLLWFLPALAAWRLMTPMVLNLRWPLGISVLLGLGVGLLDRVAQDFTLSRIFALAPFFILGAVTTPERLKGLNQPLARLGGAAVLLVTLVLVALLHTHIGTPGALYWDQGYEGQGMPTLLGLGARALMYVVGTLMLLAVLAVVPTRRTWLTGIGAASIYIYLLHGFVVRGAGSAGLLDHVTGVGGIAVLVVGAAAVCLLLGSPVVRRLTRPVIEPRLDWLLRRDDQASKSSTTSSVSGSDWQASTKPPASSSGSSA
ncbi:MAG: acyltransferase family protein [Actinomycetes bacterium]